MGILKREVAGMTYLDRFALRRPCDKIDAVCVLPKMIMVLV